MIRYEEGNIVAGMDYDKDGKDSVKVSLSVSEALEEAMAKFSKGEKAEVVLTNQVVRIAFEDGKVVLAVDTDRDGEDLARVEVDMAESFDEISQKVMSK